MSDKRQNLLNKISAEKRRRKRTGKCFEFLLVDDIQLDRWYKKLMKMQKISKVS